MANVDMSDLLLEKVILTRNSHKSSIEKFLKL